MPTNSDSLRVAISKETAQGTLPATPVFEVFRVTGEGLSSEVSTTTSEEINAISRGITDSILTGATVTGDLMFELSNFEAFELALASFVASDWAADPIASGAAYPAGVGTNAGIYDSSEMSTFTIEKKMTSTPLDSAIQTELFQVFSGCTADTFNLSITPNEIITGSFGFIGMQATFPVAETGDTYNESGFSPVMTAPLVTGIELLSHTTDGTEGTPVAWLTGSCFTGIEISGSNNGRGLSCIGVLGNKATSLGQFEISISGSLYYTGNDPLDALVDQTPYQFRITCENSEGDSYFFFFPRVKFSAATALASGTNTDVMVEFTMQALTDGFRKYTMEIERSPAPVAVAATTTTAKAKKNEEPV